MMSDALPVLSTDALTAAVTSLLQRPLPDNDQIAVTTTAVTSLLQRPLPDKDQIAVTTIEDGNKIFKEGKIEKPVTGKQVTPVGQTEAEKQNGAKSKQPKKRKQSNNEKLKQTGKSKESFKSYQNENFSKSRKCYVTIPPLQIISGTTSAKTRGKGKKNVKESKACSLKTTEPSAKAVRTNKRKQNDLYHNQKPVEKGSPNPEVCETFQNQLPSTGSTLRDLLTLAKANEQRNEADFHSRNLAKTDSIIRCAPETLNKLAKSLTETSYSFTGNDVLNLQSAVMERLSSGVPGTNSPCSAKSSLTGSTSVSTMSGQFTVISQSNSSPVSTASVQVSQIAVEPMEVEATGGKGCQPDQPPGPQNFSFSTPWVPQHLTDGMVPMLSLGPGLNIPLTIRPPSSHLVSAMLSRLPTILPKPNQTAPTYNQLQNQPASENCINESPQSQHQDVTVATTVNSNLESSVQYASFGKASNTRTEEQQAQFVSKITSGHPNLQLQLSQPVPMPTMDKPRHGPLEHQPVFTISPAKSGVVLPHPQAIALATPVNPSLNSHQHLPVSMARTQPSFNTQQHQPGLLVHTTLATASQSSQPVSSTVQAAPAQYLNDTMNPPSSQSVQQGDPTGMEIQSLMNIVYGHLMERDRVGATPTPSTLMLESSLRHLAVPYQGAQPPALVTSQPPEEHSGAHKVMAPSYGFPVVSSHQTPSEAVTLESQSFESQQEYSQTESAQLANHKEANNYQSAEPANQNEVNSYQSTQPANHNEASVYQSAQSVSHNEAGMVHQPGLSLIQPHAPAQFIQSNTTPEPMTNQSYLGIHQQEPAEYCHQSVISHTEHLQHPPPVESYPYSGETANHSTCMYRQHPMEQVNGQIGNQRLLHQTISQNVERYTNHNLPMPVQHNTTVNDGNVKGLTAEKIKRPQQTDTQPEQTETPAHTHELPDLDTDSSELDTFYCLSCNRQLKKPCQTHNTDYVHIEDSPVLSRARASLPGCFYLRKTETMVFNSLGIWCAEEVKLGTRFGPVVGPCRPEVRGEIDKENLHFNPYKVFERDKSTCYEMTDETQCNWMMFLQLATSLRNQNCVLYQQGTELYCVTKKIVKKDTELLMWFSSDLCLRLKVSQDPYICTLEQCLTCGLQFPSKKLLRSHRKSKHPTEITDTFTCYLCGKTYSSRTKLNSHTLIHMGVKPHRCVYCNKEFTDYSNLKVHQFIHTGQKKYQCPKCGRTFRQKAHLNSHVVIHTGEKNWKCKFCEKTFARQSDCKTHEYNHTQEKMYTCEVCRKVFYKLQSYKRHQKVHTGERNYMCNKCFKGFHTKYHRDRHLKICKEKSEKESTYMSLEEVANLDNTCDAVPLAEREYYEKPM